MFDNLDEVSITLLLLFDVHISTTPYKIILETFKPASIEVVLQFLLILIITLNFSLTPFKAYLIGRR